MAEQRLLSPGATGYGASTRIVDGRPPRATVSILRMYGGRICGGRGSVKALIQRVTEAGVTVNGQFIAEIGSGLLVLLCVEQGDGEAEADYLARRISALRIFEDTAGKMNLSVREVGGSVLVVSQFTLAADLSRGNRPGFSYAALPDAAKPLIEGFCAHLDGHGIPVQTGEFAAHMAVRLVNDGPVTIWLDTRALLKSG
jgi:D-aminoacyl-tRNA deacylase